MYVEQGDENFTLAAGLPASKPGGGVRSGLVALSGRYGSPRGTQYAVSLPERTVPAKKVGSGQGL